jgi:RNA polymerase sigma factor (sigma-70 family)
MDGGDDPVLEAFIKGARANYGELGVDPAFLRRGLAQRIDARLRAADAESDQVARARVLATTRGADLCLVLAWQAGAEEAWACYPERFLESVRAAARGQGADEQRAHELALGLPGELLAGGALEGYHGRGFLLAWLRVYVRRRVIDGARERVGLESLEGREPGPVVDGGSGAELEVDETHERLLRAVQPLRDQLTDRERVVLLLKYQSGLSQRVIARSLRLSEPRVTRLVQHAFDKLSTCLRGAFPEGEPEALPDLQLVWRLLGSGHSSSSVTGGQVPRPPSDPDLGTSKLGETT